MREWAARCVQRFDAFYATCPPEWVEDEDPTLLERLAAFRQVLLE